MEGCAMSLPDPVPSVVTRSPAFEAKSASHTVRLLRKPQERCFSTLALESNSKSSQPKFNLSGSEMADDASRILHGNALENSG